MRGRKGTLGGEAASLREAPLPPDPSLPKSGWRLGWTILRSWFRLRGGLVPCELVESTAADRAAADVRGGDEATASKKSRWLVPSAFLGSAYERCARCEKVSSAEEPPSKASPERGGAREAGGGVRPPLRKGRGGSVSRRDHNQAYRRPHTRCMGAQVRRNVQAYSQPLFGRGGLGERRFS